MIGQLKLLKIDEWPRNMAKQLRNYEDHESDQRSLSGLIQVDLLPIKAKSGTRKSLAKRDEISMPVINPAINISEPSIAVISSHNQEADSLKIKKEVSGTTIMKLLENSHIMEEKFLSIHYLDLMNSQVIKDKNRIKTTTIDVSRFSQNVNESKSHLFSVDSRTDSVGSDVERYKNNTVIYQINPNHKEDSQNIMGSDDLEEIEACILYYKQITSTIENHLREDSNIFKQIIDSFAAYFARKYQQGLEELSQHDRESISVAQTVRDATIDVQEFIRILCDGVNLYYGLQDLKPGKLSTGYTIFNYDNMTNFITTLIFEDKLYNLVFDLYKIEHERIERLYCKQFELYQTLSPQDCYVSDEFCLNQRTIRYLEQKGLLKKEEYEGEEESEISNQISGQSQDNSLEKNTTAVRNGSKDSSLSKLKREFLKADFLPYEKAINTLKELRIHKSPIHKFKNILKVVDLITAAIDEFYSEIGIKLSQSLTGDQMFAIFCYILARSGIKDVLTHCKIINEFGTMNFRKSNGGYYATTLEACVSHITQIFDKNILEESLTL